MRFLKLLDQYFEEVIVIILLGTMTFLVGLQVIMRYVMQDSLSWSEELARYVFIWMVNIGISYGVKKNRHISIDFLNTILPEKKSSNFINRCRHSIYSILLLHDILRWEK